MMAMFSLARQIEAAEPAIWLEVSPPAGIALDRGIERLTAARNVVDAINITDNAMGRARMSALMFGATVRARLEIAVVMNLSCRDRNLLGLRSELISAAAAGIEGIVALRGDRLPAGAGLSVNEIDPPGLIAEIEALNARRGAKLIPGAVCNPHRADFRREMELLDRRARAGARFVISQPVFDAASATRIADAAWKVGLAPFLGILPIRSAAMARNVATRIRELGPARAQLERYMAMDDREVCRATLANNLDLMESLRGTVGGFVIMSAGDPTLSIELAGLFRGRRAIRTAGSATI
jgi:5,10-methylenetetrahydrofolate reductase